MEDKILVAKTRDDYGTGASRRLRRNGYVPAIIYGAAFRGISDKSVPISLNHNILYHAIKRESFHTSILNIDLDGKIEKVLLRSCQMHAYLPQVLHIDFQRVNEKEEINIRVPLHFINEDISHAVKVQRAHITVVTQEVEVRALASNIPPFVEVDLKNIKIGETIHLSDLKLPSGVTLVNLLRHDDSAVVIASGIKEQVDQDTDAIAATDVPTVNNKKDTE